MRSKQLLNGLWEYRIGQGTWTPRQIPFSAFPVGESTCVRRFDAAPYTGRAFLVFDGITYAAQVMLNGTPLGRMLPYVEYRFEITGLLLETDNRLEVLLSDIAPAFGPSEGWENYGGIIRDVYIEYTSESVIQSFLWDARLNDAFTAAECIVTVQTDGAADGLCAVLLDADDKIAAGAHTALPAGEDADKTAVLQFSADEPALWTPETPQLYTLVLTLLCGGKPVDELRQKVGFKKLECRDRRFYLNGAPVFLLGVNRHDLWGDEGHTMTEAQMEQDMRAIKATGCNFVRLAHYPHHKRIIELADELGLLLSEEPGLWWSDVSDPDISAGALEVMRRCVLRDRNNVSIAFWLAFNECIFTPEFLRESARVCRENDPTRPVSGANCMSIEMTKEQFPACGFDFYTMHPYAPTPQRMRECAAALTELPLLFSEWGGWFCHGNPALFRQFIETIIELWRGTGDDPVVAGAVYWEWNGIFEFDRGAPACYDGILTEGLVDPWRNPLPELEIFREAFAALHAPAPKPALRQTVTAPAAPAGVYRPLPLESLCNAEKRAAAWAHMLAESKKPIPRYYYAFKNTRKMTNGPCADGSVTELNGLPAALLTQPMVLDDELAVPVDTAVQALWLIGCTSMPQGWPIGGSWGDPVLECTLEYTDSTADTVVLRNGQDITTATALYGPSRIDPQAAESPRALYLLHDSDWERYVVNLRRLPADAARTLRRLILRPAPGGWLPLLYGITAQL